MKRFGIKITISNLITKDGGAEAKDIVSGTYEEMQNFLNEIKSDEKNNAILNNPEIKMSFKYEIVEL